METNTRPIELSEVKLIGLTMLDLRDHIMPILNRASVAYANDKIATDQLSFLSEEIANVSSIISTIYIYRDFQGDKTKLEKMINENKSFEGLKLDTVTVWKHLERITPAEISELNIIALNRLTD